jgi:hypothetical protein
LLEKLDPVRGVEHVDRAVAARRGQSQRDRAGIGRLSDWV